MSEISSENLYLNRAKFLMRILGVWMPRENENFLHKLHRYFMMSLQYFFLLFQIIYIFQVWGDMDAVSQASYVLFTQACLCFKITLFQLKIPNLKDLLTRMNGETFRPQSNIHKEILKYQAGRIKRLLLFFLLSAQATCGMWALKPLFDDVGTRNFPFDMWMPVRPEQSPHFEFGYAFQFSTICMSACMYFGVDSVALSMVIFGCAQLVIIRDKLMSINSPLEKSEEDRDELRKDNYKKLIECSVQHQDVISFAELVEATYHTYLLFQLTGSVGLICMSALRMLVVDPKSMQFVSIVTYLTVMVSQLFVCCWCGHELTAKNEEFHMTLYSCAWHEQDRRFKSALCFMMMRAGKPLVLRAGHYITLSRQTFVAILRMSYSYFAVLKQTTH